jgi:hypothetical protein
VRQQSSHQLYKVRSDQHSLELAASRSIENYVFMKPVVRMLDLASLHNNNPDSN